MLSVSSRFLPAVVLGAGVLLISGIREQFVMRPRHELASITTTFAGFQAIDQEVDAEQRRVAGMSDYVMREFRRDSAQAFSVYVGYYDRQVQGKSIHSPKNCLPGAGWDVIENQRVALGGAGATGLLGGTINRALLANGEARVMVYYWYQGRGRIEANEYKVKWDLLRDAALYGRTEEALVRLVVPFATSRAAGAFARDRAQADSLANRIALELAPAVEAVLPVAPSALRTASR